MRTSTMKKVFIAGCLWLAAVCATAQISTGATQELQAVADVFRTQKIAYDFTMSSYDQKQGSKKPLETSTVSCYLWYPYSVFKYDGVEFYHNDKIKVAVYRNSKKVIVNKADKRADKEMASMPFDVDSLLMFYRQIDKLEDAGGKRTYRIFYKEGLSRYSHTDISFDTATYRLSRISIFYSKTMKEMYGSAMHSADVQKVLPRVDMVFSNYRVLGKNDWKMFGAPQVVTLTGAGKAVLTPAYATYKLSDYYKAK
jgi:hypothetical protein